MLKIVYFGFFSVVENKWFDTYFFNPITTVSIKIQIYAILLL